VRAGGYPERWQTATVLVAFAALLGFAGCTHGPPQLRAKVENARLGPNGRFIAVAVDYEKYRPPTGINAFPNGGVPKVLEKEARVYLCDLATMTVTRLAAIEPSAPIRVSFSAWIAGWEDGEIIFRLTGRAGTALADYEKKLNEEVYRVDRAGGALPIARVPQHLLKAPRGGGGPIEVGSGFDTVTVKRAPHPEWVVVFRIDPATGQLVASQDI
jgi:hypothetical protein